MNIDIALLKGLADKSRIRIIDLLLNHDFCVGALAEQLEITKAAVSQHLQILRMAGLVKGEKRGYWTHYSVQKKAIHQIADELKQLADQSADDENACLTMCRDQKNNCKG